MLKISKTETYGWDAAIRGMRNPKESWDKIDSYEYTQVGKHYEIVGDNDRRLMEHLAEAGPDHGKFLRMITVTCDILAPLYWWKEFDTYKVGTVANSCSTMHKIASKKFTLKDFSWEHLEEETALKLGWNDLKGQLSGRGVLSLTILMLNRYRDLYNETKDKKYWWQMIQLLPSSYNQLRTVQMNYAVLRNIYHARRNHKLDEWHTFCDWLETLPESQLITGEK